MLAFQRTPQQVEERMHSLIRKFTVATVLSFSFTSFAAAADLPREGRYDFTSCWSGQSNLIQFSKTHSASSFEMTGINRSNPPGGLFDKNVFRCVGTTASLGGKSSSLVVCEAVDPDGDRRLSSFTLSSDGKLIRENVTGTGKYEGLAASGTVQPLGPFPVIKAGTFNDCNHQTGTYKLRSH